jgi:hypothetical protein
MLANAWHAKRNCLRKIVQIHKYRFSNIFLKAPIEMTCRPTLTDAFMMQSTMQHEGIPKLVFERRREFLNGKNGFLNGRNEFLNGAEK